MPADTAFVREYAPGGTICMCPACLKKTGYPGIGQGVFEYKNIGFFHGTRRWDARGRGPMYLGMELELHGARADAWRHAVSYLGGDALAEVKPDGGMMEMTSHPMSLPYFMAHYPWQLLPELQELGVTALPDHGGLHIHVNKTAFDGAAHIYNWLSVFYENPTQMRRLGGRTHTAHWANTPPAGLRMDVARHIAAYADAAKARHAAQQRCKFSEGRLYIRRADQATISRAEAAQAMTVHRSLGSGTAINDSRHTTTFEVRFPGASINPAKVKSRLQLIGGAFAYAKNLGDTMEERDERLRFAAFREWVTGTRRYPELAADMAAL